MILLVVGLVAVIVVILIAVFLSIRLGRGDEHDDETDVRPSSRSRRVDEDGWREPPIRDVRRSPQAAQGAGRGIGERHGGMGDARRRNGEPGYGGARDRAGRTRDRGYDDERRQPARRDSPEYASSPARRRSAAPVSSEGRGRYDTGSSRRVAADDFPSADYPAAGHAAEDYPSDHFASGELPAVSARAGKRPDSRRKAAPAPAVGKSRSRPHRGKRDDDDDWPSNNDGEWDKLSDEQYWAELSADKPLATMARPAQSARRPPASSAKAPPAKPAAAKPPREERDTRREERDTRTARPAAAAARLGGVDELSRVASVGGRSAGRTAPERDGDRDSRGRRGRPAQHEAVTERLPVRSRQPAVPAARMAAEAPAAGRDVPVGAHSSLDTGPYATRGTGAHARKAAPPPVPGALEDDPLTSPSFSMKAYPATDSRAYGHARKSSRAPSPTGTDNNATPLASDPLTSNGASHTGSHDSRSYLAADYSNPTHAYPSEPAAAAPTQWYGAPPAEPAPAPGYGNPYSYPPAGAAGSPASASGDPRYDGYLADQLHVYSPPPYESPVSAYPDSSGASYPALPTPGMAAPATGGQAGPAYPEAYPQHLYTQGQPPPYPDGSGGAGYAPGYENGYGGDPYAGGGYGGYPPQG